MFGAVFLGIYLPLWAYVGLTRKRLVDTVRARHPESARAIYAATRSFPQRQRWSERFSQYERLPDAEVQARIHQLARAETVWGWAIVGPLGVGFIGWLVFMASKLI